MIQNTFALFITTIVTTVLLSCTSAPNLFINEDVELIKSGMHQQAVEHINNNEKHYEQEKNVISFYLDRGMASYYAGNFESSFKDLAEAERLIEKAFTRDISDYAAAFAKRDVKNVNYSGEDYENIYINVFNTLNYFYSGNMEAARVEIRRSNEKLRHITGEYAAQAEGWKAMLEGFVGIPKELNFSNSALTRYLSALVWQRAGYLDDSRIDAMEAANAFNDYPDVYNFPMPPFLHGTEGDCAETNIPDGMARLNLLVFTGLSPLKIKPIDNYFWYREDILNYGIHEIQLIDFPVELPREKKIQVNTTTLKPILTAFASYCSMNIRNVFDRKIRKDKTGLYALMLLDLYVNDEIEAELLKILTAYRYANALDIIGNSSSSEISDGYRIAASHALQLGDKLGGIREDVSSGVADIYNRSDPSYKAKGFRPPSDKISELRLLSRSSSVTRIEAVIDGNETVLLYLLEDMGKVTELLYQRRKIRNEMAMADYITEILSKGYDKVAGVPVVNVLAESGLITALVLTKTPLILAELGTDAVKGVTAFGTRFLLLFVDLFTSTRGIYDAIIAKQVAREMGRFDDRMGAFFPDKAYAGGINLAPGVYSITINYYNNSDLLYSESHENVRAEEGKLNLVTGSLLGR